jgi:Holliday junction resolvasome RuvABC ATP-dependent DNA helicase subunit
MARKHLRYHKMMNCILEQYKGGPVGLDTIAVSIGEERVTIEDVYEPFLIQKDASISKLIPSFYSSC